MDMQLLDLVGKLGVIGICLYVISQGQKREERNDKRQEIRDAEFVKQNDRQHESNLSHTKALTELTETLRNRPCIEAQPQPWERGPRKDT